MSCTEQKLRWPFLSWMFHKYSKRDEYLYCPLFSHSADALSLRAARSGSAPLGPSPGTSSSAGSRRSRSPGGLALRGTPTGLLSGSTVIPWPLISCVTELGVPAWEFNLASFHPQQPKPTDPVKPIFPKRQSLLAWWNWIPVKTRLLHLSYC